MKHIYELEAILTEMMEEDHELCNTDDMSLYVAFIRRMNPQIMGMRFDTVLSNRIQLEIPALTSVSRAKRKVHEKRKDLRPNKYMTKILSERAEEFVDFAKQI